MRSRTLAVFGGTTLALASLGGGALAASSVKHYKGGAGPSDTYKMSFTVVGNHVQHFTFQSRCPGLATGVTVPAKMTIKNQHFSYKNQQFTVTGHFVKGGMARGTERDKTGDCDSGLLTWSARVS